MIFVVSASFFEPSVANISDLVALLRGAAIRGHSLWVVDDPSDAELRESGAFEAWRSQLPGELANEVKILRETLQRLSPQAVTRGAKLIRVVPAASADASEGADVVLDLDQAIRLVSLPLFLLVEDAIHDAAFLRRVLPLPWRSRLDEWEASGTVCFEHGGGAGSMKRIVESYCTAKALPPLGLDADAWRASRFIIFDQDTTSTGGLGDNIGVLKKACGKHGMPDRLKILERPKQENYLPKQAILSIIDLKTQPKDRDAARLEVEAFFSAEAHHQALVPDSFHAKNAFFKLAGEITWHDSWFADDGSAEEMTRLAEQIAALM